MSSKMPLLLPLGPFTIEEIEAMPWFIKALAQWVDSFLIAFDSFWELLGKMIKWSLEV